MSWSGKRLAACLAGACCLAAGCRTLPPGTPPAGPIVMPGPPSPGTVVVPVPEVTPGTNPEPGPRPAVPLTAEAAVEYMLTSLATRCPEIGSAGAVPPSVANAFSSADREVNRLPMEVWQGLIRMNLIRPVRIDDPTVAYRLESVLQRDAAAANRYPGVAPYRWRMRLERLGEGGGERWREEVGFGMVPAPSEK